MQFPFVQVIVVGGTGQTGRRIIEELLSTTEGLFSPTARRPKIIATSQRIDASKDLVVPAGDLASTVQNDVQEWKEHVEWRALDLEADSINSDLERIEENLNPNWKTVLIFAAAYTNVEGCETNPLKGKKINETNTIKVLKWAAEKFHAKLVFYSTDYVFDGLAGPYSEQHERNPICEYGKSKMLVEEFLEQSGEPHLIVRTTGVYDYLPGSKNFLMQMLVMWSEKRAAKIPSDQFNNPVWAKELAHATLELLWFGYEGIFNIAGGEWDSRDNYARKIAKSFGYDSESLIEPVLTADLNQKAKRPLRCGLRCEKLLDALGWTPSKPEKIFLKWSNLSRIRSYE